MVVILSIVVFVFVVALYSLININERHDYKNGVYYKALHIALPGYGTIYYPEQRLELKNWIGSKHRSLKAISKETGKEDEEATAGLALQMMSPYRGYKLFQESDGHWILYKPEKKEKFFTMRAYYKIGPWTEVEQKKL